ncbi:MAG: hypothetical protein HY512_03780 [Candidatus Aenigmarchaeota archaeon]|nr:hypothetical protein [Candidatus Aenigmarchaeota archaeon]
MKDSSKRVVGAIIVLVMFFSIAGSALFYTQVQQTPAEQPKIELQQITERQLTNQERLLILQSGGVIIEYTYKDLNYTKKTEIENFVIQKTEGKAILSEYKSEEEKLNFIGIDKSNPRAAEVRDMVSANTSTLFNNFCDLVLAQPAPLDCSLRTLKITGGTQPSPTSSAVQNSTQNQTAQNATQNATK